MDFAPSSYDEIGDEAERVQRSNRKRRRKQMRGQPPSSDTTQEDAGVVVPIDLKKRPVSIPCSLAKFNDIVKALDGNLKALVRAKDFGGVLLFKPHSLDRQLLSLLMRKLNLETMKLEIGGGKVIAITEHNVRCVFQIPNTGSNPPLLNDDEAHVKRRELGVQICGSAFKPK